MGRKLLGYQLLIDEARFDSLIGHYVPGGGIPGNPQRHY